MRHAMTVTLETSQLRTLHQYAHREKMPLNEVITTALACFLAGEALLFSDRCKPQQIAEDRLKQSFVAVYKVSSPPPDMTFFLDWMLPRYANLPTSSFHWFAYPLGDYAITIGHNPPGEDLATWVVRECCDTARGIVTPEDFSAAREQLEYNLAVLFAGI